jgi:ribosomal protein S18 acetylase RimI-like enzyme
MNTRAIQIADHKKLLPFWKENYFVNELDEYEPFLVFLEKNPNLSFLAEENGEIVGTVLGSFDGRRGYIQKLVVRKNGRNQGLGRNLIKTVVSKLRAVGALYIPINAEEELTLFYEKCGFAKTSQVPMSISYSTYTKK